MWAMARMAVEVDVVGQAFGQQRRHARGRLRRVRRPGPGRGGATAPRSRRRAAARRAPAAGRLDRRARPRRRAGASRPCSGSRRASWTSGSKVARPCTTAAAVRETLGDVHDQHDRRPGQAGDVGGRGEARRRRSARRTGPSRPRPPRRRRVRRHRAVQQQRDDPLLADQVRVEVAARAAGGQGVVAGVDVVGADLVAARPPGPRRAARPSARWRRSSCRGRMPGRGHHRGAAAEALTTRCPAGPSGRRPSGA